MKYCQAVKRWSIWKRNTAHCKGFTLIELVMVLSVMAILAGTITLSIRSTDRYALNNASLMLQADLRLAQRMALTEGRRYGVMFNLDTHQYHFYVTGPVRIIKTVMLPNGVKFMEASASNMEYLPRGTGSHGLRLTLEKGNLRQQLTATVSGGRIAVKEIYSAIN